MSTSDPGYATTDPFESIVVSAVHPAVQSLMSLSCGDQLEPESLAPSNLAPKANILTGRANQRVADIVGSMDTTAKQTLSSMISMEVFPSHCSSTSLTPIPASSSTKAEQPSGDLRGFGSPAIGHPLRGTLTQDSIKLPYADALTESIGVQLRGPCKKMKTSRMMKYFCEDSMTDEGTSDDCESEDSSSAVDC